MVPQPPFDIGVLPTHYVLKNTSWACNKSIGTGSTGEVFVEEFYTSQSGPVLCAVKRQAWNTKYVPREFAHQKITSWANFLQKHPSDKRRFVELIGISVDKTYIYTAQEYMMNGDLKGYIDFRWSEGDVKIVAQQLFEALKLMHDNDRLHLDLKPAILFPILDEDDGLRIKIGDFGICKFAPFDPSLSREMKSVQRGLRDLSYMAPELFEDNNTLLTPATDSWSVGCVSYRLLTGHIYSHRDAYRFWRTGNPSPRQGLMDKGLSEDGINFIEECLREDPETRLTATAALEHPWLKMEAGYKIGEHLKDKLNTRSRRITSSLENDVIRQGSDVDLVCQEESDEEFTIVNGTGGHKTSTGDNPYPKTEKIGKWGSGLFSRGAKQAEPSIDNKSKVAVPTWYHPSKLLYKLSFGYLGRA